MSYGRLALLLPLAMSAFTATAAPAKTYRDVEYATAGTTSLRLDAWVPHSKRPVPAVIIVHGGGWVTGDRRSTVQPLFQPIEHAGLAWFSISYRLVSNVMQFGRGIDDVVSAVRYVRAHAAEYNIDPDRIALIGESAGGQLAIIASLRLRRDEQVHALVALYAPTDLVQLAKTSDYVPKSIRDQVQGKPWEGLVLFGLSQYSPIDRVKPGMPPFLLIHGTDDALVPYRQSVAFCDKLRENGDSCEIYAVPGGGHGIRWWEAYPDLARPYKRHMIEWLDKQLRG